MKPESSRGSLIDLNKMDFSKAYQSLTLYRPGPTFRSYADAMNVKVAMFTLNGDLSPLFPYINAVAADVWMMEKPRYIKFMLEDHSCALYPQKGLFTPAHDLEDANLFLKRLILFIEEINRRCDDISPNYRIYAPASPVDIYQLLPGTNCKSCGYATCLAFAAALSRQKTGPDKCPHFSAPVAEKAFYSLFDNQGNCIKTLSLDVNSSDLHHQIRQTRDQIQVLQEQLKHYQSIQEERIRQANYRLSMPLTRREVEVLQCLAAGSTNKEISNELYISVHTVKSHVINIFNKIGVNDRTQASVWAATMGLL